MTKRELVMDILYGPNHDTKETFEQRLNRVADAWEADTKDTARLDKLQELINNDRAKVTFIDIPEYDSSFLRSAIDAMEVE